MKNFILSIALLSTYSVFGQVTGDLVFFSNLGEKFYVVLNGIQQNQKPESNVKIEGLAEGWYSCRVVSENNLFSLEQNVGVVNNTVITYRIINKKGVHRLRYYTEVPKNTYSNPQGISTVVYHTDPYVQTTTSPTQTTLPTQTTTIPSQTTQTTTTQTTTTQTTTGTVNGTTEQINMNVGGTGTSTQVNGTGLNESININIGVTGTGINTEVIESGTNQTTENMNMNIGINGTGINTGVTNSTGINSTQTQTTTTTTTTTTNNGVVVIAENTVPVHQTDVLSSGNCVVDNPGMQKALTMVKNESFSEDKMRVAKQFARTKCLTVDQIAQFGNLFSFSEDKMNFVKFAHPNCINKQDYYELMELFTFSEDKEELENFLNVR